MSVDIPEQDRNELIQVDTNVKHSPRGASSAHRWLQCPGSIALIEKIRKTKKLPGTPPFAAEGTAAHHIGAECLINNEEAWEYAGKDVQVGEYIFNCNEEMVEGTQLWVEYVQKILIKYPEATVYVEKPLGPSPTDEDAFGTSDTIIHVPGVKMIIADFKYGKGLAVEADSTQNKYYGYLATEEIIKDEPEDLQIDLVIIQPRKPHPDGLIRTFSTTKGALQEWWQEEMLPGLSLTRDPNAHLKVGSHCRFCDANKANACPALKNDTNELKVTSEVEHLSDEEVSDIMKKLPAIKAFLDNVQKETYKRMVAGRKIEGFKLVKKRANRAWRDTVKINGEDVPMEQALIDQFGEDNIYTPRKILGPPHIEKLPGGKNFVIKNAFKPDTGLTVAADSDSKEAVISLMDKYEG